MTSDLLQIIRSFGYLPEPEPVHDVFSRLSRSEIRAGRLPQSTVGTKYLDNVFSHRFKSRTFGHPSLHDAFYDDVQMKKVVDYVLATGREPDRETILKNLRFNVKVPSHFFPDTSSALCRAFAPGGRILDVFTGWGGRSLGAICSGAIDVVSVDVQPDSAVAGRRMVADLSGHLKSSVEFVTDDFAAYMSSTNKMFDMIIASPPFLDTEDYGHDLPRTFREWTVRVAIPLVRLSAKLLNDFGVAVIHCQDRPSVPVLSILYAAFQCSGFTLAREFRYGKTAGQSVLVWKVGERAARL